MGSSLPETFQGLGSRTGVSDSASRLWAARPPIPGSVLMQSRGGAQQAFRVGGARGLAMQMLPEAPGLSWTESWGWAEKLVSVLGWGLCPGMVVSVLGWDLCPGMGPVPWDGVCALGWGLCPGMGVCAVG